MTSSVARTTRRLAPLVVVLTLLVGLLLVGGASGAWAQGFETPPAAPLAPEAPVAPTAPVVDGPDEVTGVTLTVDGASEGLSNTVTTILLLTVASLAPILLLLMTTFTRFVIVLSLVRNGIGLQSVPPAQVLIGLALFLTMFAMSPTLTAVNDAALQPFLAGEMDVMEAAATGYEPMRDFMLSQTREDDLRMFLEMSDAPPPASPADIGPTTLVPAFVISELRTAFTIGFVVFVPFLVVDLVVAAVLMSLGMVMLPPIFVSLPLKLLLFVLVDGWSLLSRSLVLSVVGG
jgi:flagellar biosynthesis protein FliP